MCIKLKTILTKDFLAKDLILTRDLIKEKNKRWFTIFFQLKIEAMNA